MLAAVATGAAGVLGPVAAGTAAADDGPAGAAAAGAAGRAGVLGAGTAGNGAVFVDDAAGEPFGVPRDGGDGGDGAGGGDSTIVGSRSLLFDSPVRGGCSLAGPDPEAEGWVRGTLGNAPARAGARGSGGRESRCGPGQSQIDRCGSAGGAPELAGVANAGDSDGEGENVGVWGAVGASAPGVAGAAAAGAFEVSGVSLIASALSSPAGASPGLPS